MYPLEYFEQENTYYIIKNSLHDSQFDLLQKIMESLKRKASSS
jgi:hypothetical protein